MDTKALEHVQNKYVFPVHASEHNSAANGHP